MPSAARPVAAALVGAALLLGACTSSGGGSDAGTAPATASRSATPSASTTSSSAQNRLVATWPNYHRDASRSGTVPTLSGVTRLRRIAQLKLDGQVYASPIVVGGMTIVATENDVVYAFDSAYHQVWKVRLGTPSPSEQRQCGDITPLGITGTPAFDADTGDVYLVAELGGSVRHELFALDPDTGATRWSRSVDLPGVSARDMQQRGALAVSHGNVWVSYGAQAGDCGNYKGRVVGVPASGRGATVSYTSPTKRGGGIWNPGGPTVLPGGDVLVVSANGAGFPGDAYDHTNSVIRLNADAQRVDSFAPSNWAQNNQADVGLGSQSVALVGSRWAVLGGKSGPVYVLNRDRLGGIGGEVSQRDVCPVYGGAAVDGSVVYLPCSTGGLAAVRVGANGRLTVLWHADGGDESVSGAPVVGGGRVFSLDPNGGVLHALDPRTGKTREQVDVGTTSRFATPAVSGHDLLVPTLDGLTVVRAS